LEDKMIIKYAMINIADGTIHGVIAPSDTTAFTDGSIVNDRLIKIWPEEFYGIKPSRKRWNGASFVDMPAQPNEFYIWENAAWTFQQDKFMDHMRTSRDGRLFATDWTQVPDAPLTAEQVTAFRNYRQDLRDVPNNLTGAERSLDDIAWPTPPVL